MRRNKGFTLAELLIIVAIIAILVGISMPIFTSQLEKSRRAVDKANARNIEAVLGVAANSNEIEFTNKYVEGSSSKYACIAVIVGKDKVKYYVSGKIKINGIDFNSGDHDYSRLKKLLDKNNILDYRVKSNDGWNFYAVFLYSDGTMKIGSGNDNGFNEYEDNTFETHANNWKNRTDKSSIEK
ncbi:MAG: prepilin-type N-terminal cleavage/methylation domain-containing protein [Erysipelotrichaceae bacterium]|nr:prepilin-type N-terminal cleavage/methylation domain-containing protein [Solobacterium sp.]MDY3794145.1 prepilin-type N-terminal cleavage/methylation domain-containing protein [Erysipelotrichaceae bacterium]